MLNHSNCEYNLAVHPSSAHTRLPKSAQIKTTDYVCVETISNALMYCNWYRAPRERFPVALGLVYSTCGATSLGELSRGSPSSNFLSVSVLLTVLEISASAQEEDNQTGPLIPHGFAQLRVLLEEPYSSEQVVVRRSAQLKSKQRHTIPLSLLLREQGSLVMGLVIMETNPTPFLQQFVSFIKHIYYSL